MSEYREGYGQAKADILKEIKAATELLSKSSWHYDATPEQRKELRNKIEALRWVRAIVKSVKSSR